MILTFFMEHNLTPNDIYDACAFDKLLDQQVCVSTKTFERLERFRSLNLFALNSSNAVSEFSIERMQDSTRCLSFFLELDSSLEPVFSSSYMDVFYRNLNPVQPFLSYKKDLIKHFKNGCAIAGFLPKPQPCRFAGCLNAFDELRKCKFQTSYAIYFQLLFLIENE